MSSISDQISKTSESKSDFTKPDIICKKTSFDWNLFDKRGDVLRDLRQKREFVDLMIVTEDGGQEIAHLVVVSALGKYFTDYIEKETNSSDVVKVTLDNGFVVKKVLLKNVNKSVLKIIVDCSYNGFISTNMDTIWPLVQTAELYSLEDILDSSLTYLIKQLNVENCVQVFHLGLKHRHKLSNASYVFIRTNFTKIVDKCIDFPDLSFSELKALVVDDELNVRNETIVFNSMIRWINHKIDSRKGKVFELLSKLRFARFELSFIENNISKHPIISEDKDCNRLVKQFKDKYNSFTKKKDGNGLYIGLTPEPIRSRIPYEIGLAYGGWQEGITSTLMETFDIRTNRWFDTKLSHNSPRAYHGLEAIDGLVYIIGGTNGTDILKTVECFHTITKKWYERSPMSEQRCYVSTAVIDGVIYAMGGHNGRQRVKTCEKYDTNADKWTAFEAMNMTRSDASAAVRRRKIYIAGGLNDQMIENTVEVYSLDDQTWSFIQPMTNPRTSLGFVCFEDSLYAIGGNNGIERLRNVERYDFKLRSWLPVADMKSKRSTFATAVIEDQLYAIGGYNGQTPISLVEKYDEKEKVWTEVKSLRHDRSGLAVCVIKGLSNAIEYSYIGLNSKKDKNNSQKFENKVQTQSETIDEEMDFQ